MYQNLQTNFYLSRHCRSLTSLLSFCQHTCLLHTSCLPPRRPSDALFIWTLKVLQTDSSRTYMSSNLLTSFTKWSRKGNFIFVHYLCAHRRKQFNRRLINSCTSVPSAFNYLLVRLRLQLLNNLLLMIELFIASTLIILSSLEILYMLSFDR